MVMQIKLVLLLLLLISRVMGGEGAAFRDVCIIADSLSCHTAAWSV